MARYEIRATSDARRGIMTIHEILRHPDYQRFAEDATACGRAVLPGAFPWKFMGLSDAELRTADLRFDHGTPIRGEYREALIQVVRANEQLVIEHWQWWQAHLQVQRLLYPAGEQMALFN